MSEQSSELLKTISGLDLSNQVIIQKNETIYLEKINENLEKLNKTMENIDVTLRNWFISESNRRFSL